MKRNLIATVKTDNSHIQIDSRPGNQFNGLVMAAYLLLFAVGMICSFLNDYTVLFLLALFLIPVVYLIYNFSYDRIKVGIDAVSISKWFCFGIPLIIRYSRVRKVDYALVFSNEREEDVLFLKAGKNIFEGAELQFGRSAANLWDFGEDDGDELLFYRIAVWLEKHEVITPQGNEFEKYHEYLAKNSSRIIEVD